jgi:hypothetical protein
MIIMITFFVDVALTLVRHDKGPQFVKFDFFLQASSEKQDDLEQEEKKKNKVEEKTEETEDVSKEEEEEEEKNKETKADTDPFDACISSSDSEVIPQILRV